jgi:3-hydroxybutyryl-CoA dehydrogenase
MAIQTVGVVGCGLMGSGIAQVCAEAGYAVVVREVEDDLLRKGLARIDGFLQKGVERGKVTPARKSEVMGRLRGTTDLRALALCDIVIEAVVESLGAKREV